MIIEPSRIGRLVFRYNLFMALVLHLSHQSIALGENLPPRYVRKYILELFSPYEFLSLNQTQEKAIIPYRLFITPHATEEKPAPLVVWLHGYGEHGNDNRKHLKWLELLMTSSNPQDHAFSVLAVQCIPEHPYWYEHVDNVKDEPDMCGYTFQILEHLLESSPIDRNRIYLIGASSGGAGCWEMAMRSPYPFAAVAPLATAGTINVDGLDKLSKTPIWAFHTKADPLAPVAYVREIVDRLNTVGGSVHLTETSGHTHDSWSEAFLKYKVSDWLLEHDLRERGNWDLPSSQALHRQILQILKEWHGWQLAFQAIVLIALLWGAIHGYRTLHRIIGIKR